MIQIVHWKDSVPEDFMIDFIKIEKALSFAKRNNRLAEAEADIEKKDSTAYEKWRTIRWKMRHAGYESKTFGKDTFWCRRGWLGTAEVTGKDDLKFKYFADSDEKPMFISLKALMEFEQELGQDEAEGDYYKRVRYLETKIIKKAKVEKVYGFSREE